MKKTIIFSAIVILFLSMGFFVENAYGAITCEQPVKQFIINPADGIGLWLRDAPAAGSGATSIVKMPNDAVVDRCNNAPQNGTWRVVSYSGNIGWANMKSEWVDPVTSASPSPSPSTPPAPAAGLLICEQPAKKFVINPADGTGLALRDAPAAGSGATSITNMPNGAEVDRCANSPKNTTWYVVSYGGNIGWANMKSEWVDPVTSESPSPSAAGTPAGGTASPASTYSCQPPECTPLKNPLGTVDAIPVIFGNVIKALTGFMGSAALLVFIYGGVMWIMSGGNAERVKKGNQAMIWAVVGIVVIFSSYAIITLVIEGMGAL